MKKAIFKWNINVKEEIENQKRNHKQILEVKTTTKEKNSPMRSKSRLIGAEERISELEDRAKDIGEFRKIKKKNF